MEALDDTKLAVLLGKGKIHVNCQFIRVKPCNKVIFSAAPPYARSNVGLQMGQNTQAALSTQVRNSSSKEISNVTIVNFQVKCNII